MALRGEDVPNSFGAIYGERERQRSAAQSRVRDGMTLMDGGGGEE
jgi:hypothetical protein